MRRFSKKSQFDPSHLIPDLLGRHQILSFVDNVKASGIMSDKSQTVANSLRYSRHKSRSLTKSKPLDNIHSPVLISRCALLGRAPKGSPGLLLLTHLLGVRGGSHLWVSYSEHPLTQKPGISQAAAGAFTRGINETLWVDCSVGDPLFFLATALM